MGEKKQREEASKKLKKVLIVGACVLFVVLMIVSGMGSGWITGLNTVKPGDAVVLDYTLYNSQGNPVVTTDQQIWKAGNAKGNPVLYSKQITVTANQTLAKSLFPVQVYSSSGSSLQYAIFTPEFTTITQGILGLKVNEKKTIAIPAKTPMTQTWSAESLARQKMNISDIRKGDMFTLGVSDNQTEAVTNSSAFTYIRTGEVTEVSPASITVDLGFPTVDVSVVSINGR
jgi:FKBP-type peptidyl-prolyl cis-trans isomerase 2